MKKIVIAVSLLALMSMSTKADVVGVYIGGQVWDNEAQGVFGEKNNYQQNFNFSDQQQGSAFIAVEHPLPLIPNIKISKTKLDTDGTTTLNSDYIFGETSFADGIDVNTVFNVSYVDYTLYYELFDNDLLTFDFGITARDIKADINVKAAEGSLAGNLKSSAIIPLLYVSTVVGLPFTGFNVFVHGNLLTIDDNTLYDYQAGISYELLDNIAVDLNLTLGYRSVKLELEDLDNLYADLDFKGVFVGAVLHF
ncbi:MAG: TIGR04219 family outer membrane beta-barrel protein [Alteromonadaceae bacterium]|nr:TIGR04219 family outer membrane beta-barrel protein [Alteromonadaceae bacterium]